MSRMPRRSAIGVPGAAVTARDLQAGPEVACGALGSEAESLKKYKRPKVLIDPLMDTASCNGNLRLSTSLRSGGTPEEEELKTVSELTRWMTVNGEAICGTRPEKIWGEGTSVRKTPEVARFEGTAAHCNERGLFFVKVKRAEMVGLAGKLTWKHGDDGLHVQAPAEKPCEHAVAFRIV